MTGILNLLAGAVSSAIKDAYFNLTTLLLPGNGTNGAQNNTFLDSSTNNFTITRNGNTTQGTFSPFSQTGWSNFLDGTSGQFLNAPANAAFNFGTGDFTVEAWVYPTSTTGTRPIIEVRSSGGANGFALLSQSGALTLNVYTNSAFAGASTNSMTLNAWNHVALTRSGNTWTYWINGASGGSFTNSSTQSDGGTTGPKIGGSSTAGEVWIGYISNARITKGGALYTSAFTPSTTPLTTTVSAGTVSLLTCQSNRFIDNSTNAFAITVNGTPSVQAFSPFAPTAAYSAATVGGSGYFDGSGDYLTVADNAALDVSSGDFTVECWFYASSGVSAEQVIVSRNNGNILTGSDIQYNLFFSSGSAKVRPYSGGTDYTINVGAVVVNSWNHIALVRTGNTFYGYLNGARSATTQTISGSLNTGTWSTYIGNALFSGGGNSFFTGYCSGVRVTKGGALYTGSTYTVPTSPFTTTVSAGTANLLLNYTNAGITDATAKNDLETVGNASISTTQSKFGGSSMYFDGTGDLLALPNNELFNLSSGDFTIEGWFYANSTTSNGALVSKMNYNGTNWTGFAVFQFNQTIVFYHANAGSINNITTGNVITSTGTWYHIAVVKSGTATNNTKIYIDGVQQAQGTPSIGNASKPLTVGGTNSTYGWDTARELNCYIDDLRITRYARYTSAFTPPTAPFALQ